MTRPTVQQVGTDIFLVGGTAVNWTILRDGRWLTLVDSGYPADGDAVVDSIEQLGHRLQDVAAVLVTHGHVDHIGGLPRLLRDADLPVYAAPPELAMVRGEVREQATPWQVLSRSWRPSFARWAREALRAGGNLHPAIKDVRPLLGGVLDVPGRPVPRSSAGHTTGHTAFHLPDEGVLLSGDSIVTGHPLSARSGPQLLPAFFAHDAREAFVTLDALAGLSADLILPGHGAAWRGTPREAVALARAKAPRAYAPLNTG